LTLASLRLLPLYFATFQMPTSGYEVEEVLDCLRKADIPEGHGSLLGNGDVYYRVMFVKKDVHGQNFWGWATKARIDSWGSGDALSKYIAANGSAPRQVPPRSPSPSVGETGGSPAEEKTEASSPTAKKPKLSTADGKKDYFTSVSVQHDLARAIDLMSVEDFLENESTCTQQGPFVPLWFSLCDFFPGHPFFLLEVRPKGPPFQENIVTPSASCLSGLLSYLKLVHNDVRAKADTKRSDLFKMVVSLKLKERLQPAHPETSGCSPPAPALKPTTGAETAEAPSDPPKPAPPETSACSPPAPALKPTTGAETADTQSHPPKPSDPPNPAANPCVVKT